MPPLCLGSSQGRRVGLEKEGASGDAQAPVGRDGLVNSASIAGLAPRASTHFKRKLYELLLQRLQGRASADAPPHSGAALRHLAAQPYEKWMRKKEGLIRGVALATPQDEGSWVTIGRGTARSRPPQ